MLATRMAKKKSADVSQDSQDDGAKTTLTVRKVDQKLVMRAAGVRGQSVEELFMSEDVRTFWRHLMIEAVRKETEGQ